MKLLHKLFLKYLYILPIVNLLVTFTVYFTPLDIKDWVFIGNLSGYSIITSLVYVGVFCFSKRYCAFTKITSYGLLAISVFNSISCKLITNQEEYLIYESMFSKTIIILVLLLTISISIIKCKPHYTH